jgi:hypothetical protein
MHAAHNALKRGARYYAQDKGLLKSCWVCLESLRSSYGQLLRHVAPWARARVAFEDSLLTEDEQRALWQALGVQEEVVSELLELQLRWDVEAQQLKVARWYQNDLDALIPRVVAVVRTTWRFEAFSESRWLGLGASARGLVAATLLGLEDLVAWVLRSPGESHYYLGGFAQYTDRAKGVMGMLALAGHLPDGVLSMLLPDDRVPQVLAELDAEMDSELEWLASLSPGVWQALSRGLGLHVPLRHLTTHAMLVSVGYMREHLRHARDHPWSLCGATWGPSSASWRQARAPTSWWPRSSASTRRTR